MVVESGTGALLVGGLSVTARLRQIDHGERHAQANDDCQQSHDSDTHGRIVSEVSKAAVSEIA
jgi:hypothetical protein